VITPPPPPPAGPSLKTPAVRVAYKLLGRPRRTTRFRRLHVKNVPRGSRVVVTCLTKKGRRCKGKLRKRFTKTNARGSLRVKRFERKRLPAGSRLQVVVTNPQFVTQIKLVRVRKSRRPSIRTRCQPPGETRRAC
jgi:hypothetical protein